MTVSPGQALKATAMWGAYREVAVDRRVVAAAADIGSLWSARPVGVACDRRADGPIAVDRDDIEDELNNALAGRGEVTGAGTSERGSHLDVDILPTADRQAVLDAIFGVLAAKEDRRDSQRPTVTRVDHFWQEGHNRRVIASVFFDVGETIVDESREYGTWADWLGVPRHTFSAVFGAVIARGLDYRETFQVFRPGFHLTEERERRAAAGQPEHFSEENLYPDARPCLAALRELGVQVGLAGNQTARAETILRALDLPVDVIGTSDGWGVEKPSATFFERVVAEAGCPADQVLYVGDRLDNDIRPAQEAGIATALVRRGPWGHILDDKIVSEHCLFRLDSLAELPELVRKHNESAA